jgi:hypothetical protein
VRAPPPRSLRGIDLHVLTCLLLLWRAEDEWNVLTDRVSCIAFPVGRDNRPPSNPHNASWSSEQQQQRPFTSTLGSQLCRSPIALAAAQQARWAAETGVALLLDLVSDDVLRVMLLTARLVRHWMAGPTSDEQVRRVRLVLNVITKHC